MNDKEWNTQDKIWYLLNVQKEKMPPQTLQTIMKKYPHIYIRKGRIFVRPSKHEWLVEIPLEEEVKE